MFDFIINIFSDFLYFVLHIGQSGSFPPALSQKGENRLIKLSEQGDKSAKNKLIEYNLRLVAHVIKKYYSSYSQQEDLISIGTIGLIKAVDSFNSSKGTRLATYAARCIDNEPLMMLRARKKTARDVSLYEPIGTDKEGNEINLLDVTCAEGTDAFELLSAREDIRRLRQILQGTLSDRELEVIRLRYGLTGDHELTQREIGQLLGISRSYVSRIEKKALKKLRIAVEDTTTM